MAISSLIQYIQKTIQLSKDEIEIIHSLTEVKFVPKKTILFSEGDICHYEAFVVKGCAKTYYIDKDGFEVILTFAIENWWVGDLVSFQNKTPSRMYVETLEDCELIQLSLQNKELLLQKIPALERFFRLLVQKHLGTYQERLFDNVATPAKERYEKFLIKYPSLSQRIAQHQIASFLGISPEFLSRLRTKK